MPWAFAVLLLVFVIGTITWVALGVAVDVIVPIVEASSDDPDVLAGLETAQLAWDYFPLWFLGVLSVFAISESIRQRRGGRL